MHRDVKTVARKFKPVNLTGVDLQKAAIDVLAHPTVASKRGPEGDIPVLGLDALETRYYLRVSVTVFYRGKRGTKK